MIEIEILEIIDIIIETVDRVIDNTIIDLDQGSIKDEP
jgi:hypothetical protein